VVGVDGVAVFDALHRRSSNGADLRPLPFGARKAKLARVLARKPARIVFNEHTDEDGATEFRHACKLGFEGMVSKRVGSPHRSPIAEMCCRHNTDKPSLMPYKSSHSR
jgi:bifunctional non-homologous end joining protein LigD